MAIPLFVLQNERKQICRRRKLIENFTEFEIQRHTGLPVWGLREIINIFEPISGHTKAAIPLETKVLCFLGHLRSGSFQYCLASSSGIAQPTASKIISECLNFILPYASTVINFPETLAKINKVKQDFASIAGFPNVIGLIDGSQIPIKAPRENESVYVCRKQFHSVNTQVICGPDLSFVDVVAKWPGSTHDSFIYNNSGAKSRLYTGELGDGWIQGDSGYPLEERLLTPFQTEQSAEEKRYNKKHKTTRCAVERAIGTWKSRFRCIDRTGGTLCYDEVKCCKIIIASAILHNICIRKEIPLTTEDEHHREIFIIPDHQSLQQGAPPVVNQRQQAVLNRKRIAQNFQ